MCIISLLFTFIPTLFEEFIVKVEPHTNGPLFVEIAFYLKAAKAASLNAFRSSRGLSHLGVPHFVASGSLTFNEKKFRFLVLPRYGSDLQSIIDSSRAAFSPKTACDMAVQVVSENIYWKKKKLQLSHHCTNFGHQKHVSCMSSN
jgi:hypothetical protein